MKTKFILIYLTAFVLASCSDFIEVDAPTTQIVPALVFETEASAASAIRGVYSLMMSNPSFTRSGIEEYTGVASDELVNYATSANRIQFYQNSITSINSDVLTVFWGEAYKYISNVNVIIEGLEKSTISENEKKKLIGEAMFIRGFCYFYLANLFGDVPYLTTSNYEQNAKAPRSPYDQVLLNIEKDLLIAVEGMTDDFATGMGERIRPNKFTANALLSRLYLYMKNWAKAEQYASEVIESENFVLMDDLSQVFLANSMETIWQLKPVTPNAGAPQASVFVLTGTPNGVSRRVTMTPSLVNSFEPDDNRKATWVKNFSNNSGNWNFIFKYTTTNAPVEYSMVFRLAEQYLIRSEAKVQQGKLEPGLEDLNAIRIRAGLNDYSSTDKNEILDAILRERRVELFGEYGHRWLDLKRSGKIDEVLSVLKPQWQSTDALLPIPNSERLLNTSLTQNPGY